MEFVVLKTKIWRQSIIIVQSLKVEYTNLLHLLNGNRTAEF